LTRLEHRFARVPPSTLLRAAAHRLATLEARMGAAIGRRLERDRHRFEVALRDLEARSPIAILSRGYSLVFDERGRLVKRATSVEPGARLSVRLAEGGLRVRVVDEEP
jgi:exodeoxyribonuclease VII large subunit